MNRQNYILSIFFAALLLGFSVTQAKAQKDFCFEKKGREFQQRVSMTIMGKKIEGTFESGGYQSDTSMETFDFTGTKNGGVLNIKFDSRPPYELPPGTKKIVWTLGATTLKIPTYGKNFYTKKSSNYEAAFGVCQEN